MKEEITQQVMDVQKSVQQYKIKEKLPNLVRNRRYQRMKQLAEQGYFSEQAIKLRHPELYYIYVGKYTSANTSMNPNEDTLTDFLSHHLMGQQYKTELLKGKQQILTLQQQQEIQISSFRTQTIQSQELAIQQQNLIEICELIFLNGQQKNIDYAIIDSNQSLDDRKIIEQDQQDRYFDGQQPEFTDGINTDTGILDY